MWRTQGGISALIAWANFVGAQLKPQPKWGGPPGPRLAPWPALRCSNQLQLRLRLAAMWAANPAGFQPARAGHKRLELGRIACPPMMRKCHAWKTKWHCALTRAASPLMERVVAPQ